MRDFKAVLLAIIFSCCHYTALAATGDILYQNCTPNSGCTGAASGVGYVRTVENSGCQNGSCLKLDAILNIYGDGDDYGSGDIRMETGSATVGKTEITVQYYIRFNKSFILNNNIKEVRPYVGSNEHYYIATINPYWGGVYMSVNYGTLDPEPPFTPAQTSEFCVSNGDGTFYMPQGKIKGSLDSAHKYGTTWRKITQWIKLPSTSGGTDGESKLWIDDDLMFHLYNSSMKTGATPYFTGLTFYPSSEANEAFEHWMDEMIIYEGYVPPTSDGGPMLSNPLPSATLPYGTTQTTLGVTTDGASTCRYGTTPGVEYDSIANTFTNTGGVTHTQTISGLTNGQDTPYYIRCNKDTVVNEQDFQINITVYDASCGDDSQYCQTVADCEAYWPTYSWCGNVCQEAACVPPGGTLSQGGSGTLSQGGTGTTTQ